MTRETSFEPQIDRYEFDFKRCSIAKGFAQIDTEQDAWYFGTWVNPSERRIVSYLEGDIIEETAADDAELANALRELAAWNAERNYRFGIDPGLGDELREKFEAIGVGDLLH